MTNTISLRPSSAGRWVSCPASPSLEAPFPNESGPLAEEGTAAHWVAEMILTGKHSPDELIERRAENGYVITGEMVDHVRTYIDHVRSVATRPNGLAVETHVTLGCGVEGTADAAYLDGSHLHVWDLKYGWNPVEAKDNWQGATYIIGLWEHYYPKVERATFHIVQPRPWHLDGRIRSWELSSEMIEQKRAKLYAAVDAARSPESMACTGTHCGYCRAVSVCPSARRASLRAVEVSQLGTPENPSPEAIAEELKVLRSAKRALEQRLDGITAVAEATLKSGGLIPGWSMSRAFGQRKFKSEADLLALEAMTGKDLHDRKACTPAEAERRGVDEATLELFTTKPETGLKLVEQDPSVKAAEVFGSA